MIRPMIVPLMPSALRTEDQRSFSAANIETWAVIPEVAHALLKWVRSTSENTGVLIGGIALSLYTKRPRATEDVDVMFLSEDQIPEEIDGFTRNRQHAFKEKKTHVEIEVLTAQQVAIPKEIVEKVFHTAVSTCGLKVASLEGMIALKLFGSLSAKRKHKDLGDVQRILEAQSAPVDMDDWPLPQALRKEFSELQSVYFG